MKKLGFRFSAVPRDRHPAWFGLPILTRSIGHELYAASCAEDGSSKPVPVHGNWRVSLCRTLCINPEDRASVSRAFMAMERAGLIQVRDGSVHVVWNPHEPLFEPPLEGNSGVTPRSLTGLSGVTRSETPGNDSTLLSREEEIRREKTRGERARDEDSEFEPSLEHEIRIGFSQRLEHAAAAHPNQKALGAAIRDLVPWVEKTAPLRKLSESELVKRMLDGFFANDNAKAKRYPPSFLAQNPLEYVDPPQLKSVVRAKFAGPSEVPTNPQDYAVPEGGVKW